MPTVATQFDLRAYSTLPNVKTYPACAVFRALQLSHQGPLKDQGDEETGHQHSQIVGVANCYSTQTLSTRVISHIV